MAAGKSKKKNKKRAAVIFIILLIVVIALAYSYSMGYLDPVIELVNKYTGQQIPSEPGSGSNDNPDSGTGDGSTGIDESYDLKNYLDSTPPVTVPAAGDLNVHFVNVGQGDCIIIQFPDGANMIIDAGSVYNSNTIRDLILEYIDNLGITVFDYLMLTHTDGDHIYYMDDVILRYDILNFYSPSTSTSQATSKAYKAYIDARDAESGAAYYINASGLCIEGAGYRIDFYSPSESFYSDVNNYSPIIILQYAGRKLMFVGDAEKEAEEEFLENNPGGIDVDLLKVGHHGSETSSTQEFIDAVKPEYAVICVNVQQALAKKWIHPNPDVLARLAGINCTVYRTDLRGNIVLTVNSAGVFKFTCKMEESESGLVKEVENKNAAVPSVENEWCIVTACFVFAPKNSYTVCL